MCKTLQKADLPNNLQCGEYPEEVPQEGLNKVHFMRRQGHAEEGMPSESPCMYQLPYILFLFLYVAFLQFLNPPRGHSHFYIW